MSKNFIKGGGEKLSSSPWARVVPLSHASPSEVATLLQRGEIVVLPTETVYGLSALAKEEGALRILEAKGERRAPLALHFAFPEEALRMLKPSRRAEALSGLMPGPLLIVGEASEEAPRGFVAPDGSVGVRCPGHEFVLEVIRLCGPLLLPSANRGGALPPTTLQWAFTEVGKFCALAVDGGPSEGGVESTVVDIRGERPKVLRPGLLPVEKIKEAMGEKVDVEEPEPEGRYLRRAKLVYIDAPGDRFVKEAKKAMSGVEGEGRFLTVGELSTKLGPLSLPLSGLDHPEEAARKLYSLLAELDREGLTIISGGIPKAGLWLAVRDRLIRAASQLSRPSVKLLFVCEGNTCRSVMAERLARKLAKEQGLAFEAHSAGLEAKPGNEAASLAVEALRRLGVDASGHAARRLEELDLTEFDLVVTMTRAQKESVKKKFPESKVVTLTEAAGLREREEDILKALGMERDEPIGDVLDPYGASVEAYETCARQIKELVGMVLRLLFVEGSLP